MTKRYHILPYTYKRAKRLGVTIAPSDNPKYKLRVTDKQGHTTYVGALGYADYPTYMHMRGKKYARTRRRLYKIRHESDRHKKRTRGWYADQLLW